jgi:cytochrome c oxidase subunit II
VAPHSHAARDIANLFWWMMGGAWLGLALVVGVLFLAWRRAGRRGMGKDTGGDKPGERAAWWVVIGAGVITPIVLLTVLFVVSDVFVIRTTDPPARAARGGLTVEVVGHQWWWEIRYPASGAVTANELHIPVRTPVRVEARTADVIHSFWVPELNRKIDTVPGRTNTVVLEADRPGVYRGECSEFCGLQHANMGVLVYAQPPAAFRTWLAGQAKPEATPGNARALVGRALFLSGACASCHTIRGTSATGTVGPDMTHFGSRTTIAALAAPNNPSTAADWIDRSQSIKPGNQMPDFDYPPDQVHAIVAYLEGLK